jgi:uncharacterized membrane protein
MTTAVLTALIGLIGSFLVAAFTYWATKRRERDTEWRKEKLIYYKAFVESMSGIILGDETPEGHKLYAKTTNNLLLFAPQSVIEALNEFRSETAASNADRSQLKHDNLLAKLLLAIRKDIGANSIDDQTAFKPVLWSSGVKNNIA